nr:hypothetical protein [Geosporobacter ferrireducens]
MEKAKEDTQDSFEEVNGLKFLVDKELLQQFQGFTIDYSDGWFSKGFRIIPGIGGASC